MITLKTVIGEQTTIDLSKFESNISKYATPLLKTSFNMGMSITPESAKLVRIGTFAIDPDKNAFLGATGLLEPEAKDITHLLLVYFDGPAVIEGFRIENGKKVIYHVEAKEKGFLWVEAKPDGKDLIFVTNRQSNEKAILTIQIEPQTKKKIKA